MCHGGRQKGTLQLYDPYASLGSYTVTLHTIDDAHSYKYKRCRVAVVFFCNNFSIHFEDRLVVSRSR